MKLKTTLPCVLLGFALSSAVVVAQDLPAGYWSLEQANEIQGKTRLVVLDPDLSVLTAAERSAVGKLIEAGKLFNRIYQDSLHPQALTSLETLENLAGDPKHISALLDIFYRSQGPITTTLDNQRVPFLPVIPEQPGKNVYPTGLTVETLDGYLVQHPGLKADILNLRTVVRASTELNLKGDLEPSTGFRPWTDCTRVCASVSNRYRAMSMNRVGTPFPTRFAGRLRS